MIDTTSDSDLRKMAIEASQRAHAPYSKVKVGSALKSKSGRIFLGCNIENASFGGTICSERVAFFNAISEGQRQFEKIYIYTPTGWPPCGFCRQIMAEFVAPDFKIIIGNKDGTIGEYELKDLLPHGFSPEHLK